MKKLIPLIVLVGLLAVPFSFAAAQVGTQGNIPTLPGPTDTQLGSTPSGIVSFICIIFNYAFFALLLAAVGFVLLAAYRYLTASGDPGKVSAANKTLIFAAVAIAVALLARAIPVLVGNFVLTNQNASSFDVCA